MNEIIQKLAQFQWIHCMADTKHFSITNETVRGFFEFYFSTNPYFKRMVVDITDMDKFDKLLKMNGALIRPAFYEYLYLSLFEREKAGLDLSFTTMRWIDQAFPDMRAKIEKMSLLK